jgi:hypothetical protein
MDQETIVAAIKSNHFDKENIKTMHNRVIHMGG